MFKPRKKHLILTAAGAALQLTGNICLLLALVGVTRDLNTHIKQRVTRELSQNAAE